MAKYSSRTLLSAAEVEAFLKQERKENSALLRVRRASQEMKETSIPPKRHTRLPNPMTSWTSSSLKGCPGWTRGQTTIGLTTSIRKMIDAEETGCRIVPDSTGMRNGQPYAPTTTQWGYRGGE